jgi:uncharacterized protein YegJ (DUF2314 family)
MIWAIQKARITWHFFEESFIHPLPHQEYFSVKVKVTDISDGSVEHLWVANLKKDEKGQLYGEIANEPVDIQCVELGQYIRIYEDVISDWMIVESSGRLIGGYTIRAIRDELPETEVPEFDKSLGGIYIDEGVDHIKPSFETPEGAINALEYAYDEQDMEKVLACKDFVKEAKLMLDPMELEIASEELIEPTAEVLQLSFVKNIQEHGFPQFSDMISKAFVSREFVSKNHYIITQICTYTNEKTVDRLHTYQTEHGWRVLSPVDDELKK